MSGTTTLILAAASSAAIGTGIINGNAPGSEYLQYGALGLCTLMVVAAVWCIREVLKYLKEVLEHLAAKDKQMQDLIERDRAERERRK